MINNNNDHQGENSIQKFLWKKIPSCWKYNDTYGVKYSS